MPENLPEIKILRSHPLITVQDNGRAGFQSLGVPEGGVLDRPSMRLGNALVGNHPDAAVLEICLGGLSFATSRPIRIALTGTKTGMLNVTDPYTEASFSVPSYRAIDVKPGRIVSIGALPDTTTAILALSGGVKTDVFFGSHSVSVNAGIGKAVETGDSVPLGEIAEESPGAELMLKPSEIETHGSCIRVVMGPHDDRFTDNALTDFLNTSFKLSPEMNRMGIRLEGKSLSHKATADIKSEGISTGSVQVPGSGKPIILLADHQTTGGYTKIATVISADIPLLARMQAGDTFQFKAVKVAEAEMIARKNEKRLQDQIVAMVPATPILDVSALYSLNNRT